MKRVSFAAIPTVVDVITDGVDDAPEMPDCGDVVRVLWTNETWETATWSTWCTGFVVGVLEKGEVHTKWSIFYPPDELRDYFKCGHSGTTIVQNLHKMSWEWATLTDEEEYSLMCKAGRVGF